VIGKHLFLAVDGGAPLLLDTRLLAGRHTGPVGEEAGVTGVRTVERRRPLVYDMPTLF
jgi:hypothetical protein